MDDIRALLGDGDSPGWQDSALCAQTDPDAFFPEKGGSTREAKKVCRVCDVRTECLEYALEHDERFGIWGGLSERERRRLKRDTPAAPVTEKTCVKCLFTKPAAEFYFTSTRTCKACWCARDRQYKRAAREARVAA